MSMQIAAAVLGFAFAAVAANAQTVLVTAGTPAQSEDATSMPEYCAERDLDCVLVDGLPRPVVMGALVSTSAPNPGAPAAPSDAPAARIVGPSQPRGGMR